VERKRGGEKKKRGGIKNRRGPHRKPNCMDLIGTKGGKRREKFAFSIGPEAEGRTSLEEKEKNEPRRIG